MNRQYLSKDKIKYLKEYFDKNIPTKTRAALINIKVKKGLQLYGTIKDNTNRYWKFLNDEILAANNEITAELNRKFYGGNPADATAVVNKYIDQHPDYKKEWELLWGFDGQKIDNELNGFDGFAWRNYIGRIDLAAVIESESIDQFLSQYEKKNTDPEALKKTEKIKSMVNEYFGNIQPFSLEYNIIIDAVNEYLANRDEQKLHNKLNR